MQYDVANPPTFRHRPSGLEPLLALTLAPDSAEVAAARSKAKLLTDLTERIDKGINSPVEAPTGERTITPMADPSTVHRYLQARKQLRDSEERAKTRAAEASAQIEKLTTERAKLEVDLAQANLGEMLADLDKKIAAARQVLAAAAAAPEAIAPLVSRALPAAEETVGLVARDALQSALRDLDHRRREITESILKKAKSEFAELLTVVEAISQLGQKKAVDAACEHAFRILNQ